MLFALDVSNRYRLLLVPFPVPARSTKCLLLDNSHSCSSQNRYDAEYSE